MRDVREHLQRADCIRCDICRHPNVLGFDLGVLRRSQKMGRQTVTRRREFTRAQKAQIIKRASDTKGNIWCEGCGINVTGKVIEIDHVIAEALVVDKTKPLVIEDGRALGRDCCHRAAGGKTAQDVAAIAKAKRREARHIGAVAPSIAPIQSRGFPKARPQNKASRPIRKWFGWQESGGNPVAQDAGSIDCPPHGMEPASAHSARTR